MIVRRRLILTSPGEQRSHEQLTRTLAEFGCQLIPKMRVADVLVVDNSGITNAEFSYAMRAHFDFVVARHNRGLFGVEFDGKQHTMDAKNRANDELKDRICRQLGFPLLRIEADALEPITERHSVLEWLVQLWFRQEAIADYQVEHGIDDVLEACDTIELVDGKLTWPLNPALKMRAHLWQLHKAKRCRQPIPFLLCWHDHEFRRTRAVAILEIERAADSSQLVAVSVSCRSYDFGQFGLTDIDLVETIALKAIGEALDGYLRGERQAFDGRGVVRLLKKCRTPPECQVDDTALFNIKVDFSSNVFALACATVSGGAYGAPGGISAVRRL